MGNLHASSVNPSDPRPFQKGEAEGVKNGHPKTVLKEWLVDTGASISALTRDNAEQFDLTPLGGSASATTGGGGILIKAGLRWFSPSLKPAAPTGRRDALCRWA